ncbi:MAG: hypothetical protein LBL59_00795 [Xanthomonadaceae bacterium]|jgi:hypothetical protein|nr:hypothetical protein [Xanthomonadaceae bacterium]
MPTYRGQGTGHLFFDYRGQHARSLGRFRWTAFCSLERSGTDPRKPADARSQEAFWTRRGYAPEPGPTMRLRWNEAERTAVGHKLAFWLCDWESMPSS